MRPTSLSGITLCIRILAKKYLSATVQVTEQLKQGYNVDQLDDVRIIRDRQTSTRPRGPKVSTVQLILPQGCPEDLAF